VLQCLVHLHDADLLVLLGFEYARRCVAVGKDAGARRYKLNIAKSGPMLEVACFSRFTAR